MHSPQANRELSELRKHLEVLGLPVGKFPSVQAYRRKYKGLLRKHHPDKGGDLTKAQELTRSAGVIFEFLTTHPNRLPREGTVDQQYEDDEHLKVFEKENDLKKNDGSITFHVEVSECKAWVKAFQTYLKVAGISNAKGKNHHLFTEAWDIVGRRQDGGNVGSVSVMVYMSTGTIMIQGSLYMAFVSLGLQEVACLVQDPERKKPFLAPFHLSDDDDSDSEPKRLKKAEKPANKVLEKITAESEPVKKLSEKVLEKPAVELEPVVRSDEKVKEKPAVESEPVGKPAGIVVEKPAGEPEPVMKPVEKTVEKPDVGYKTVEKPAKESTEKVVGGKAEESALDKISVEKQGEKPNKESTENVEEEPVEGSRKDENKEEPSKKITAESSDIKALNINLANMQQAIIDMKDSFDTALDMSNRTQIDTRKEIEFVRSQVESLSADLKLLQQAQVQKSSPAPEGSSAWADDPDLPKEWILKRFESLDKSMDNVKEGFETKMNVVIEDIKTVHNMNDNLKQKIDLVVKETEGTKNILTHAVEAIDAQIAFKLDAANHETPEVQEVKENKKTKGVILTSSIGKKMNKERLEAATDSEIEMVLTYHLEEKEGAIDQELHLAPMLAEHVKDETSWVVIGVGTNDITSLDNTVPARNHLEACKKQSEFLIESAKTIVRNHDVDVFLFQQPPRYDKPEEDKDGNWAKLSKLANSHMAIMAAGQEKIHVVETSSLAREEGRGRRDLYQEDGIHLTPKGTYILETSLIMAMHKEKPGLRSQRVHTKKPGLKSPKKKYAQYPAGQQGQQRGQQGQQQLYWGRQQGQQGRPQQRNTNQWQGKGGW